MRGPRSLAMRSECSVSSSLPVSERSSPQISGNYFLPTMVSHPSFYNNGVTVAPGMDRNLDGSPANISDEFSSDYNGNGPFDGIYQQKYIKIEIN